MAEDLDKGAVERKRVRQEAEAQREKVALRADRQLGFFLAAIMVLLTALLVAVWPTARTEPGQTTPVLHSLWDFTDQVEVRLLVIVLLSGALGSAIFSARSYASFHGLKRFDASWTWWYVMRIPVGMGLALFLYMVVRGGLFSTSLGDSAAVMDTVNPFGIAALAALAGMFAKEASDKLEEIFQSVFRTAEKPAAPPKPVIERLEPADKAVGDANPSLTVFGKGFDSKAKVTIAGKDHKADYKGPDQIVVTLVADDLAKAGQLPVIVVNPSEKGGSSNAVLLSIE